VGGTKTITITADNAVVSISGYLADASGQKHIVEQTSTGTTILGSFSPAAFTDRNGDNFAKTVVLPAGTYSIGAVGSPGAIFVTNDAGGFGPVTNISGEIASSAG